MKIKKLTFAHLNICDNYSKIVVSNLLFTFLIVTLLNEKNIIYIVLTTITIWFLYIAFSFDGTGDCGDSVAHFQIAEAAMKHPALLLDHWGKPIFTLLALPFAQFGFIGIKIFNIIAFVSSAYLTYRTAEHFEIKSAWVAPILLAGMPIWLNLTFSGLTEPLSALILITAIYLTLEERTEWLGALVLSFMPFIRSEGLIMLCIFSFYSIYRRQWKLFPILTVGHIVYGIIGLIWVHHDFFWIFTKNPYASMSAYSVGRWYDFIVFTVYNIDYINAFLFVVGSILLFKKWLTMQFLKDRKLAQLFFLIYGCLSALIVSHSIFWTLGIFNSFGMQRVLITVFPLIAVVGLLGLDFLLDLIKKRFSQLYWKTTEALLLVFLITTVLYLPFFRHKTGSSFWRLDHEQRLALRTANYIKTSIPSYHNYQYYYEAAYLATALQQDRYDTTSIKRLIEMPKNKALPPNSIVIFDSHFGYWDGHYTEEKLDADPRLHQLKRLQSDKDSNFVMVVYTNANIEQ